MTQHDDHGALDRRAFFRSATIAGVGAVSGPALLAGARAAVPLPDATPDVAAPVLGTMCKLTPQQAEGPFYIDSRLVRRDITESLPGLPMDLYVLVVDVPDRCAPIPNAIVDVWHCDADRGAYSGFTAPGTFLRGVQTTGVNGITYFETLFPGWYRGRTTHIHFKVHLDSRTLVTSQLYFDDALPDLVYTLLPPYTTRGRRDTNNARDRIFSPDTVLTVLPHPAKPLSLIAGLVIGVS